MEDKRSLNLDAFKALRGVSFASPFAAAREFVASIDDPSLKRQAIAQVLLPSLLPPEPPKPKVVLLVHGILTTGEWQHKLEYALKIADPEVEIYPVTPGYVDLFRFLWPWGTREKHIRKIESDLRAVKAKHPTAEIMVVAHSFGTYIVTEILKRCPDISLDRLILCGAIVRRDYNWHRIAPQLKGARVVNDIGCRDIWPLFAKQVTTGYGDSGRFGFGTIPVFDRYFKYKHSQFFRPLHFRKYWVPYLTRGQIVSSPYSRRRPTPSMLAVAVPYKWLALAGILGFVGWRLLDRIPGLLAGILG